MRALFGVVSLLVVLAIVGLVTVRQLKAVGHVAVVAPSAAASDLPPLPNFSNPTGNVAEQSRQIQKQVADDVAKAMAQGAAAHQQEADKP